MKLGDVIYEYERDEDGKLKCSDIGIVSKIEEVRVFCYWINSKPIELSILWPRMADTPGYVAYTYVLEEL